MNAEPHVGYAFELIEADLAARARRRLGQSVRFLGGTDEYSLKNVLAAEATGEPTEVFVDRHAAEFAGLAAPLRITFDDFIRTIGDPRHRPAVERLWRACAARDLYERNYTGSYCVGCEQFYDEADLDDGHCPARHTPVRGRQRSELVLSPFRLHRPAHRARRDRPTAHHTRAVPRRDPCVSPSGLADISVSRSVERARGWGIPVPDDPRQVIYVWFDALTNYLSTLDYGSDGELYDQWWRRADERIHVVGKGITRFHAIYWPAFLLSAREPLPTRIQVHPYLSLDGAKLSKSSAASLPPTRLTDAYGADALRWWVACDVNATVDTDFTLDRLIARTNDTLANGFGKGITRVTTLRHRNHNAKIPPRRVQTAASPDDLASIQQRIHRPHPSQRPRVP